MWCLILPKSYVYLACLDFEISRPSGREPIKKAQINPAPPGIVVKTNSICLHLPIQQGIGDYSFQDNPRASTLMAQSSHEPGQKNACSDLAVWPPASSVQLFAPYCHEVPHFPLVSRSLFAIPSRQSGAPPEGKVLACVPGSTRQH
mmetsp:Transcript_23490/g.32085  ORF Transcript_23490/g.32085 Transcript_23490/m.32085 type:complete len:146 (+) Transcript_23490:123-560(+)